MTNRDRDDALKWTVSPRETVSPDNHAANPPAPSMEPQPTTGGSGVPKAPEKPGEAGGGEPEV